MYSYRNLFIAMCCLLFLLPVHVSAQGQGDVPWQLDAVLDVRHTRPEGIEVLALTPGGSAASMGLLVGDRVLSINDVRFGGSERPSLTLRRALEMSGGQANIQVLRNGERLSLSGALTATANAGNALGCGYVSASDPTPTVSERIHAAEITMIDGRSTPLGQMNRHRVEAGERVLVVAEHIPQHLFSGNQLRQRGIMQKREMARAYKAIVVNVEPGMRYSVGARLLVEGNDAAPMRNNTYWEPVVFSSRVEACN